jgi:hypothetical protein
MPGLAVITVVVGCLGSGAGVASAQSQCGGTGQSYDVSTINVFRVDHITRIGSCEGTVAEAWLELTGGTCPQGTLSSGICRATNMSGDAIAGQRVIGCGTSRGHGRSEWKIPVGGAWETHFLPTSVPLAVSCPPPPPDDYCTYVWNAEYGGWECQSPIIIATGQGTNYRLTSAAEGVVFDINGDGVLERVAWTYAGDDIAFLAIDQDGDGQITSGKELLGNHTVAGASNGFEALQVLNKQLNGGEIAGMIDAETPLFAKLLLWTDRNHNGLSERSELAPFGNQFSGIIPAWSLKRRRDGNGNAYRFEGQVFLRNKPGANPPENPTDRDARARKVYDVYLAVVLR